MRDQSGRIQCYAQKQALGDEQFDIFKHLDLGDFVGATGTLFRTKTNEPSLKLEAFTILAKALRPPPAKWHGLEDTEIRYRQRYLDLIGNPEVKEVFLKRSAIVPVDGVLRVVASPSPAPTIGSVPILNETNVVLTATGGVPYDPVHLLVSTNIALPMANWIIMATNLFDASGTVNMTNAINSNEPERYFRLQVE